MICTIIADRKEFELRHINEHEEPCLSIKNSLRQIIWELFCDGYDTFYLNCEYGIPMWAAEIIIALKIYNNINLNIIIPYEEQCRDWYEDIRDRYFKIHILSDNVETNCTHYDEESYILADKLMISKSDAVIFFGKKELYSETIQYAKNSDKIIKHIILNYDE